MLSLDQRTSPTSFTLHMKWINQYLPPYPRLIMVNHIGEQYTVVEMCLSDHFASRRIIMPLNFFTFTSKIRMNNLQSFSLTCLFTEAMMFLDGRRHYQLVRGKRKFYGQGENSEDTPI